jgi:hypothetical protein
MYALLTSTPSAGTLKWVANTTAPIAAAAAFSQDMSTLYFQSDLLYALDVNDGRLLWSLPTAYSPLIPLLVGPDATIYAPLGDPQFLQIAAVYGTGPNMGKMKFARPINCCLFAKSRFPSRLCACRDRDRAAAARDSFSLLQILYRLHLRELSRFSRFISTYSHTHIHKHTSLHSCKLHSAPHRHCNEQHDGLVAVLGPVH